jgi:hypothetical protein
MKVGYVGIILLLIGIVLVSGCIGQIITGQTADTRQDTQKQTTTPIPAQSTPTTPTTTATQTQKCDPSYPDVCIPPSPPDLDCADISYKNFRVLPPDPHRFDGDKDGIGCER